MCVQLGCALVGTPQTREFSNVMLRRGGFVYRDTRASWLESREETLSHVRKSPVKPG